MLPSLVFIYSQWACSTGKPTVVYALLFAAQSKVKVRETINYWEESISGETNYGKFYLWLSLAMEVLETQSWMPSDSPVFSGCPSISWMMAHNPKCRRILLLATWISKAWLISLLPVIFTYVVFLRSLFSWVFNSVVIQSSRNITFWWNTYFSLVSTKRSKLLTSQAVLQHANRPFFS